MVEVVPPPGGVVPVVPLPGAVEAVVPPPGGIVSVVSPPGVWSGVNGPESAVGIPTPLLGGVDPLKSPVRKSEALANKEGVSAAGSGPVTGPPESLGEDGISAAPVGSPLVSSAWSVASPTSPIKNARDEAEAPSPTATERSSAP
jgi:hypothetical protein